MDKRRRDELDTFLELQDHFQNEKAGSPPTSTAVCAIAMNWFRKWELFVKNRDSALPGPVDNIPITVVRNGARVLRPCQSPPPPPPLLPFSCSIEMFLTFSSKPLIREKISDISKVIKVYAFYLEPNVHFCFNSSFRLRATVAGSVAVLSAALRWWT